MTEPGPERAPFRLCVAGLIGLGLAVLVWAVAGLRPAQLADLGLGFWLIAILVVVGELRPISVPGHAAKGVATSTAFVVAVLLHRGLALAALLQVVATLGADLLVSRAGWRTALTVARRLLSLAAAAAVLARFDLLATPDRPVVPTGSDLLGLTLAAAAYFLVDDLLVCGVVRRLDGHGLRRAFTGDLGYDLVTTGALLALSAPVAVVMATAPGLLPLFLLPLAAVYSTAAVSLDRDRQAHHDALTGLPNRTLLTSRAEEALAAARSSAGSVALLVLDLDRFKDVNDTLGHPIGDRLLQLAATRLTRVLRPGDTVARLGGDEFAIVLPRVSDSGVATEVGRRVRAALAEPFRVDGLLLELDASVGVALHPEHGADFAQLLQRADVAMYLAKESRTGVELYVADEHRNSAHRLALLGQLRGALDHGDLELLYQPKARFADGAVLGVEALVRWHHPTSGVLGAEAFVPLAERSGLARDLTRRVVDLAVGQAAQWWRAGCPLTVAVNLSVRDALEPDLPEYVAERLAHHGLAPAALLLEIAEGVLLDDPARVEHPLRPLEQLGVGLALDDFGTGSFSLVRLKRLPLREIKIDQAFVARLDADENADEDAAVVRSIVELGAVLGLRVVADGVDTASAWNALAGLGCDAGQGAFLAAPLAAEDLLAWLTHHGRVPVAASAALPRQATRDVEPA
ncbi:MAG TPA: EAL domain-containing protein [Mycobacteriales bacterium]|nr:EAL domain-containing protein [Mycobacteriales bacterium]